MTLGRSLHFSESSYSYLYTDKAKLDVPSFHRYLLSTKHKVRLNFLGKDEYNILLMFRTFTI